VLFKWSTTQEDAFLRHEHNFVPCSLLKWQYHRTVVIVGRDQGSSHVAEKFLLLLTVCRAAFPVDASKMNSFQSIVMVLAAFVLTILPVSAQQAAVATDAQTQSQSAAPQNPSSSPPMLDDSGWHLELSPYLWFAGTHGTVGAFGRDASVHGSAWDLLKHFDFGLMGAAEARHNRFLLTGDLLWIRLSDSSALPFPNLSATSVDVRVGQFLWTSKIGYRVINSKRFKADANVGARFWHLGQKLNFNPSIFGLNINTSQNWADIVVGGRVELPMGPKTSITVLGDMGGWNATAKQDYQFAGLLNFKVHPKWTLSAGYRYLFVDYRNGNGVYNMVTDGALLGLTYHFK